MEMMGDGVPDNPGSKLWDKPVRTGDARNYSTSIGLSATLSFPLDGGLQERCKTAADTQIQMQQQMIANKRLDFEIARLKNCGQLMQQGISFHPRSPYFKVCADVVVNNVNTIKQHRHSIPSVSVPNVRPLSPDSDPVAPPSSQTQTSIGGVLPLKVAIFFITFFTVGFTTFNKRSARGFASSAEVVATTAIEAVTVIIPADGMFCII